MKTVCVAILNYNGRKYLEHLLPTVLVATSNFNASSSIVILDNQSTDNFGEWSRREFPGIETVTAPKNDFLFSYNWFANRRKEDILIFLNNDLKLHPNFIAPLMQHFAFDDVFAVSATARDWNDTMFTCGPSVLRCHHGRYYWDWNRADQLLSHTLFASGGFMAVDRKKFLALGGFNNLFYPAYGEDLDLCFRAWRKGWRTIFEPASVVFHRENGSWDDSRSGRSVRLLFRAQLLFQWASISRTTPWHERHVFSWLIALRKLLAGESWWLLVWIRTWLEWQRVKKDHHALMTSPNELKKILGRIAEPVVLPPEKNNVENRRYPSQLQP